MNRRNVAGKALPRGIGGSGVSMRVGAAILLALIPLVGLDGWPQHSQPHGANAVAERAWSGLRVRPIFALRATARSDGASRSSPAFRAREGWRARPTFALRAMARSDGHPRSQRRGSP